MEIVRKRRVSDILLGFFLLSHPGPVFIHIIGVSVFTLLAAWPRLVWSTVLLVIAAHTAMQISIAMINDYCDRRLDADGKPEKPVPRGLVNHRVATDYSLFTLVLIDLELLPTLY